MFSEDREANHGGKDDEIRPGTDGDAQDKEENRGPREEKDRKYDHNDNRKGFRNLPSRGLTMPKSLP